MVRLSLLTTPAAIVDWLNFKPEHGTSLRAGREARAEAPEEDTC